MNNANFIFSEVIIFFFLLVDEEVVKPRVQLIGPCTSSYLYTEEKAKLNDFQNTNMYSVLYVALHLSR